MRLLGLILPALLVLAGCKFVVDGVPPADAGRDATIDALPPIDVAVVDTAVDQPPLEGGVDMAGDQAMPDAAPDLATDMAMPDFAMPDFQMPDFQMPDFAMPDFQMPDFATPDLATPDLVPPPDLMLPAPTLSTVSPTRGPSAGGVTIVVTGTNFVAGAKVSFGGGTAVSASSVSVDGKTITVTLPAAPATSIGKALAVTVTNPDTQAATKSGAFTYFASTVGFAAATTITVGMGPTWVAAGDLNGDGKVDLVTTLTPVGPNVAVSIGKGDGTFNAPVVLTAGGYPYSVTIGDVDGDKLPDLVVSDYNSGDFDIFTNNGAKTGAPFPTTGAMTAIAGAHPSSTSLADFNGDGHTDLAVTIATPNNKVAIELGPTFASSVTLGSSSPFNNPQDVIAADYDGDGNQDILVSNFGNGSTAMTLCLGDGKAMPGFTCSTVTVGTTQGTFTVGDFNGDGKPDVAVALYGSDQLGVLLNTSTAGKPSFATPVKASVGTKPWAVAAADFNLDGALDLAVADYGSNDVAIFLGDGAGNFAAAPPLVGAGAGPNGIAAADLDGDLLPDIVVPDNKSTTDSILLNASH